VSSHLLLYSNSNSRNYFIRILVKSLVMLRFLS